MCQDLELTITLLSLQVEMLRFSYKLLWIITIVVLDIYWTKSVTFYVLF